jgi:hypothetical protein
MNVGILYKAKKITLEDGGIRLIPELPVEPANTASTASPEV